jgi:hypothetical protein
MEAKRHRNFNGHEFVSGIPQGPDRSPGKPQRTNVVFLVLVLTLLVPFWQALGTGVPNPEDPAPTNIVLNAWSFEDTTNWLSDLGNPPVSFTNLSVSYLGSGLSLVVDSANPAWLQYRVVESNGTTNLTVDNGSVMFWFAPNWASTNQGGTGPGDWARLIEVGAYTEDASYGWWSLYCDPAGANLHFSAQGNDGCQTNYITMPISWTTNRWHLIALTYSSATNCCLYLDGERVTNGPPITCRPGSDVLTTGFYVGSDSEGLAQARGIFDGLVTVANPLDAGTIARTFFWQSTPYYLNPENVANFSEAPSTPQMTPDFAAITGAGLLLPGSTNLGNCVTSSVVWMTNVVIYSQTNGVDIGFSIRGGTNGAFYDVFATAGLVGQSITNAIWTWMGQGHPCSGYRLNNLPASSALLILGTPVDYDHDGLTDAYELLVSHSDPQNADSNLDGIGDGVAVLQGRNPAAITTTSETEGLVNLEVYTPWN